MGGEGKTCFIACLAVAAVVNILAFFHARAMIHWADETAQTRPPENLTWAERAGVLTTGVKIPRPFNSRTPDSLGLQYYTHLIPNGQEQELEAWFIPADQAMVLYGQSMGGAAILRAIKRFGVSPDGLVIESVFDRLVTTVQSRFRSMNLPPTPFAQLLVFWGGATAGFDGFKHNPVEYAAAVQCPSLVLHGGQDPRVSTDEAKLVYGELGGWKRFLEIESAGHNAVVAVSPEEWKRELVLLVEQIPVGRRLN